MGIERVSAPESVKFALRKLEDMESSEAAALSGATALSKVSVDLRSIQNKLVQVHQVLMNGQDNWESIENHNVEKCMMELEDISKCTETAILTFMNEVASVEPAPLPDTFKMINPKPVNFFALRKLKVGIQRIKPRVTSIKIADLGEPSERAITQSVAQRSICNVDEIRLLGLEIHRKCILQRVVDQSLQARSVVQVIGTKLFAKTVLAEKIYQSTEVKTHFDACFWLLPEIRLNNDKSPTSYLFKPIDILRKMLMKLGVTNSLEAHDGDSNIMSRLRQSLKEKRCLVVVDDNWAELWTLFNAAFPDGNNGSRVLITSEEQGFSDYEYKLPFITYKDSLNLLKEHGKKNFPEFEQYPSDISGVDSPKTSVFFNPSFDENDRIKWYSTLPSVLKTCVVYMAAVFPCSSIVHADSLIRLWIVEGIIPHEEGTTMENIAESYLDQFVQRGLFRIIRVYYHNQANQPIRSIVLDPSLHQKFNSAAKKVNPTIRSTSDEKEILPVKVILSLDAFVDSYNHPEGTDKNYMHRLAVHLPYQFNHISSFVKGPKLHCFNYSNLHSLFFFGSVAPVASSDQFSFLRVLAVYSSHIRFPEEYTPCWLDGLINLRYLGFIVCLVEGKSLGKTLDHLCRLETLDLSASIVSGISEFVKNNKRVNIVGLGKEYSRESWFPVPDMSQ